MGESRACSDTGFGKRSLLPGHSWMPPFPPSPISTYPSAPPSHPTQGSSLFLWMYKQKPELQIRQISITKLFAKILQVFEELLVTFCVETFVEFLLRSGCVSPALPLPPPPLSFLHASKKGGSGGQEREKRRRRRGRCLAQNSLLLFLRSRFLFSPEQ